MELFSLLAKLTLDKKEFDSAIKEAENDARGIHIEDPSLGLDDDEFYEKIDEVEGTDVEDPEDPSLGLDTDEYNQKIEEAEQSGETFAGNLGNIFSELKGVLITSGIVAAVASVVSSLKEGVELAKNHGDQIDKQSQKMGISAKAYQEWAYALNLSGASIDDLNRGLRTWQQAVGDEDATKKLGDAFESLGMDAEKAIKQLESGENLDGLLDNVMYALADYSGSDRGAITEVLFGKNATALNALLNATSKDIREMKQEADDLGLVMTDEEVKNAAAYMDATTRMEGAIQGLKEAMVKDLLPYLTDAANTIAKIVAFFNPRTGQQSLSEQFADDDAAFAEEMMTIEGTAAAAESLAEKLLAMGDTSKMTAEQYEIWKGTAQTLIDLVPSLSGVINTETGEISANSDEIKENIKQWENLAKQKALQTLKEQKYQQIVEKNQDLIDKSIDANTKAAEADKARVQSLDQVNAVLQRYGHTGLGENATWQDYVNARDELLSQNYGDEYTMAQISSDLAGVAGEWAKSMGDANAAKAEVEKLTEELKKGEDAYQEWLATAEAMYGVQFDEAKGATDQAEQLRQILENMPKNVHTVIEVEYAELNPRPYAIGSAYVPYDQLAYVHRGEEIRTATDVRRGDNSDGIDYGQLEDRIASAIRNGMKGVTVQSNLNGRDITDNVNRDTGRQLKARRFRG